MSAYAEGHGAPSYISARSADVILSEVRPTKLRPEALRCINTLLDELLWQVLSVSRSLATDRLKAGTAKALPTPLGKEALLEAEVELRAYWERTNPGANGSGGLEQPAQYSQELAFELLRLKCEGYSTLNDTDEDAQAESRLVARFQPNQLFNPAVVAPAALYMTAVLEFLCEHILSNVGRVASRDSSTTFATVQDLFVALSEDDSVFPVFKEMKVYGQVQSQAKPRPKSRRSQSISRSDFDGSAPISPNREFGVLPTSAQNDSAATGPPSSYSRPSSDKPRSTKMFRSAASKSSMDRDRDSELPTGSEVNEWTNPEDTQDDGMDFDDLMRSGTTMKVSLTPDRLRTFEGYTKDRAGKGSRNPQSGSVSQPHKRDEPIPPAKEGHSRRHADSEDEGGSTRSSGSTRPGASRFGNSLDKSVPPVAAVPVRVRAKSTSSPSAPPSSYPKMDLDRRVPNSNAASGFGTPKTRKGVPRVESMDINDIMDGSDDEDSVPFRNDGQNGPNTPGTRVSASTRDLMDFLSQGPPDESLVAPMSPTSTMDGRKQGRLTRMVSRLTRLQSMERINGREGLDKTSLASAPTTPTATLSGKKSFSGLQLANKPVPPRPPPLPSSTNGSSPSPFLEEVSLDQALRRNGVSLDHSKWDPPQSPTLLAHDIPTRTSSRAAIASSSMNGAHHRDSVSSTAKSATESSGPTQERLSKTVAVAAPVAPTYAETSMRSDIAAHAQSFQRLLMKATTADECRVLASMFLAKCGVLQSDEASPPTTVDATEANLVDSLLGEGGKARETQYESVKVQTDQSPANY